ncbi:MAG: hypothetical protein GWN71_32480 [Gammaproteobacteria bacterium]|nr:hypothetical protein [Gemmatimonadota bacterium]NIU78103.1 hypothetical protein [Gammaproteobacteria bacterium]
MGPFGKRVLTEGLVAGLIGFVVVALFFVVLNLAQGRSPFYTAALLGATLFYGLEDPADLVVWAGPVLAYNGVHLLVFLVLGVVAAWLASEAERGPQFWYLALSLFILLVFHMYGAVLWFADVLRGALPWWAVGGASLGAGIAMIAYLWRAHPRLRRQFREYEDQPI